MALTRINTIITSTDVCMYSNMYMKVLLYNSKTVQIAKPCVEYALSEHSPALLTFKKALGEGGLHDSQPANDHDKDRQTKREQCP